MLPITSVPRAVPGMAAAVGRELLRGGVMVGLRAMPGVGVVGLALAVEELLRLLWERWKQQEVVSHFPQVRGGGWRVWRVCPQIGRYPPNNFFYAVVNTVSPESRGEHNLVSSCLAGQSDAGQPVPYTTPSTLLLESHRYFVSPLTGYRHMMVRSWVRPYVDRMKPAVVNAQAGRVTVQPLPGPSAETLRDGGLRLSPAPHPAPWSAEPWVHVRPGPGRRTIRLPRSIEVEMPLPRPVPRPGVEPVPVVGPTPVGELVIEPGKPPVVRPGLARDVPPPRGVRERKAGLTHRGVRILVDLVRRGVNPFTEALDVVDALHDALPRQLQSRSGGASGRIRALWEHWREVDVGEAIEGLVWNQVEDYVFGKLAGKPSQHAAVRGKIPVGYGAGPAL